MAEVALETPARSVEESVGLEELERLAGRAATVIDRLRERVFAPDRRKELEIRFSVQKAADMVGRTPKSIRDAENAGRLPQPSKDERTGRRVGYTLEEVNRMRRLFGTLPTRAETDEPLVLAVQNFKGGVGKSTIVCHTAQYLALQGYRVCVVDCDSQASTTTIFGINPDIDVNEEEDTLLPYLRHGGPQSLDYAIRPTYWDGISLIPANLGLYDAEYEFAARLSADRQALDRIRNGIGTIKDRFDIILLDPPPALGMISISVLRAATALLIPVPPNNIDFGSTRHFLEMLVRTLHALKNYGDAPDYRFVKFIATKMNDGKSAHVSIKRMMDHVFPHEMLAAVLKESAEIDNAAVNLKTVYELTGPLSRGDTHRRCRVYLDAVNREIEVLMRRTWPSHLAKLRQEGIL